MIETFQEDINDELLTDKPLKGLELLRYSLAQFERAREKEELEEYLAELPVITFAK